jgi:hypothetical protein
MAARCRRRALMNQLLICQIVSMLITGALRSETNLVHRETGLLDEHLFLLLARVWMIQVIRKPRSQRISDVLRKVASSASITLVARVPRRWIPEGTATAHRTCIGCLRRVLRRSGRILVFGERVACIGKLNLHWRIWPIRRRIRLAY